MRCQVNPGKEHQCESKLPPTCFKHVLFGFSEAVSAGSLLSSGIVEKVTSACDSARTLDFAAILSSRQFTIQS
jgi:hypothetical protein